ncbi:MAG TPA: Ig-like domain-containing protein, partial [Candidatus Methanoperedens sp.]
KATTTFTALAQGPAMVNATNGSVSGSATVTVGIVKPTLKSITVSPATAMLNVSDTQVFTATALDTNNNPMAGVTIAWTSSNATVGTVSPPSMVTDLTGKATTTFTALAEGTAMVNATNGTVSGSATVTVSKPVTNLGSISGSVINVATGTGIPNVDIRLTGIVGMGVNTKSIKMETTTDSTGMWKFDNLPAGRYIIVEKLPKGFIPVIGPVLHITLAQGQDSMNNDFEVKPIKSLMPPMQAQSS